MPRQPTHPGVYVEEMPSGMRTIIERHMPDELRGARFVPVAETDWHRWAHDRPVDDNGLDDNVEERS